MNKRARLTRRILREHRRGEDWHSTKTRNIGYGVAIWVLWSCSHCSGIGKAEFDRVLEVPIAYR